MRTRPIGNSDLQACGISLHSWPIYGVGVQTDNARHCLDTAFDVGINFADTANVHGTGRVRRARKRVDDYKERSTESNSANEIFDLLQFCARTIQ